MVGGIFTAGGIEIGSPQLLAPWYGALFYGRTTADTSYVSNAVIEYTTSRSLSVENSGNSTHVVGIDSTHFRHGGQIGLRSNGSWMRYSVVDSSQVGTGYAVNLQTVADTTTGTSITFYGNVVRGSSGDGIGGYAANTYTSLHISYSEVTGSGDDGLYVGALTTLTQCNIHDNAGDGVEYWGSGTLLAENNWWGDANGPTGTNGDGVNGSIDYDPWLGSAVTIPDNPFLP